MSDLDEDRPYAIPLVSPPTQYYSEMEDNCAR